MSTRFRLTSEGRLKLSENDVEEACVRLLRYHGYPLRLQAGRFIPAERAVIQTLRNAGIRFRVVTIGEPGIPDYVMPKYFVETKAPGGILSDVQRKKIYELDKFWNLKTLVVASVEELIAVLPEVEKKAGGITGP